MVASRLMFIQAERYPPTFATPSSLKEHSSISHPPISHWMLFQAWWKCKGDNGQ